MSIRNGFAQTPGMARPAVRIEVTTKDQKALRKGGVQQVRVVLRAVAFSHGNVPVPEGCVTSGSSVGRTGLGITV